MADPCLVLVVGWLGILGGDAAAVSQAPDGADEIATLFREYATSYEWWIAPETAAAFDDSLLILWRASEDPAKVVAEIARRFAIPPDACEPLLRAFLLRRRLKDERSDRREGDVAEDVRRVGKLFEEAFLRAPENRVVVEETASFHEDFDDHPGPLLGLVRRSPHPPRTAFLASARLGGKTAMELLAIALPAFPENPAVLEKVAACVEPRLLAAALRKEALEKIRSIPSRDPKVVAYLASWWLDALMDAGLTASARKEFQALDAGTAEILLEGEHEGFERDVGGFAIHCWRLPDLRFDLAVLAIVEKDEGLLERIAKRLAGPGGVDPQRVRKLIERIGERQPMSTILSSFRETDEDKGFRIERKLIEKFRRGDGGGLDDFDAILEANDRCGGAMRKMALIPYLERQRYPDLASRKKDEIAKSLHALTGESAPEVPRLPASVLARFVTLTAEAQALLPRFAGPPRESEKVDDPVGPTIARLLAAPRLRIFEKKPLPAGIRPIEASGEETEARQEEEARDMDVPLAPIRLWRDGDLIAAIGASQDYDPVGEVSRGGYWLALSRERGRAWKKYPLGFRFFEPYVIRAASNLPLVSGDRLQIEADVRELDEQSITFPPTDLRAKRVETGICIEAALADIEKDSDGDGLTDIAEERLITDPNDRDTDGDGIRDGRDALPQVPLGGNLTDEAEATVALLGFLVKGGSPAIIHGVLQRGETIFEHEDSATLTDERTLFLIGRRASFGSITLRRRIVILSEEEMQAARKKLGIIMPYTIESFIMDRDRKQARAIWNSAWRGATLRLKKGGDGTWTVAVESSWVS